MTILMLNVIIVKGLANILLNVKILLTLLRRNLTILKKKRKKEKTKNIKVHGILILAIAIICVGIKDVYGA